MSRLFPNPEAKWNGSKRPAYGAPTENGSVVEKDPEAPPGTSDLGFSNHAESAGSGSPLLSRDDRTFGAVSAALESEAAGSELVTLEQLQIENARLRALVSDLEQVSGNGDQSWEERQKEYESLLEEKSEVIRSLHRKIQELHDRPGAVGAVAPREQELLALSEELERERRQLKEDEESLMQQMRDMEVQMSKERAELARQRNELLRLQSELRHELELASRDAALRERLAPLQRRHQELTNRRGSGPPPPEETNPAPTEAAPAPAEPARPRRDSGFFGRLFGQGQ